MRIAIAGPIETGALEAVTGLDMAHLPRGQGPSPTVPLIAELVRQEIDTHVVTLDGAIDAPVEFRSGRLRITFVPWRVPPRYPHRARMIDLFAQEIRQLTEALHSSKSDLVNAHWTYEYAEAAIRTGLPHVVTMHDLGLDYLRLYRDAYRLMRLVMKYRVMPRVRHLTAVSPYVASRAWQYGYFGKTTVIPNPISLPGPVEAKGGAINLVTIGNVGRIKNVRASVAALGLIRARMPTVQLHLFGPDLVAGGALGMSDGVWFHGNVPHTRLMRFLEEEATLLIHPSRLETFGVILGEAKIRGVPVIAGANSGGVGFVVNDAGGLLVDVERPEQIAAAALEILGDPSRYADMQRRGRDDARERFDVERITAAYLDAYQSALATRGAGRAGS